MLTDDGPRKKAEASAKPRGSTAARSMASRCARPLQTRRGARRESESEVHCQWSVLEYARR